MHVFHFSSEPEMFSRMSNTSRLDPMGQQYMVTMLRQVGCFQNASARKIQYENLADISYNRTNVPVNPQTGGNLLPSFWYPSLIRSILMKIMPQGTIQGDIRIEIQVWILP
jgi:hypothetical protein